MSTLIRSGGKCLDASVTRDPPIIIAYPVLYTSLVVNERYRAENASQIGDMLER